MNKSLMQHITLKLLVIATISIGLLSCGGGGGGSPGARPSGTVSGIVFDGPIKNGVVTVYGFENGIQGEALGTATTDDFGEYEITLAAPDQPVVLEIRGGIYIEEATGKNVSLRDNVDFLKAVGYYISGEPLSISLTFYTTIATGLAEYLIESGMPEQAAISDANERISELVGVDIIKTKPKNITDAANRAPALTNELKYGFATAAISELTKQQSLIAFPDQDFLLHQIHNSIILSSFAYHDIRHDGKLDGRVEGSTLSIGSVTVDTGMYREDIAVSMLVIASRDRNQTAITSNELLADAQRIAASTDIIYGGITPEPLLTDGSGIEIHYNGGNQLSGAISVEPQIIIYNGVDLLSAELTIGSIEYGAAEDNSNPVWLVDTTDLSNGEHTLTIKATDVITRSATMSENVTINNADINVRVAPAANSYISGVAEIIITPHSVPGLDITGVSVKIDDFEILLVESQDGTWRYEFDTEFKEEGLFAFDIITKDSGSRVITIPYLLVIDNTEPVVNTDLTGEWFTGVKPINIDIIENNLLSAELFIDGIKIRDLVAGQTIYDFDTSIYLDADHTLTIVVIDKAGFKTTVSKVIAVDNTPPSYAISPSSGTHVSGLIELKVTPDSTDGIDITNVRITISGSTRLLNQTSNGIWLTDLDTKTLNDGSHDIEFDITDSAGNISNSVINLIVDNTASEIVTSITDEWLNGENDITIEITEDNLVSAELFIDGVKIQDLQAGLNTININTASLSDGEHTVQIVIIDAQGVEKTITRTLFVDNTPPTYTVTPTDGTAVKQMTNLVLTPESIVGINIQSVKANIDTRDYTLSKGTDGNWSYLFNTAILVDGIYPVNFTVTDTAGTVTNRTVNLTVDNTVPSVTTNADNDWITGSKNITIDVVEANLTSGELFIDNVKIRDLMPGQTLYDFNSISFTDGPHDMRIVLEDRAGNATTINQSLRVDNTLPDFNVSPATGTFVNKVVTLLVTPISIIDVGIESLKISISSTTILPTRRSNGTWEYHYNSASLNDGNHTFSFESLDTASNVITKSINLSVDNTAPVITTNVDNDWIQGSKSITIDVVETNLASGELFIDGIKKRDLTSGQTIYNFNSALFADGARQLRIVVTDRVGTTTTYNQSLMVDNTPPTFNVSPATGVFVKENVDIFVTSASTDGIDFVSLIMTLNGSNITLNRSSDGAWRYKYDTLFSIDGIKTIRFKSTDTAGNILQKSISLTVDNTAPVITSDLSSDWLNKTLPVTLTITEDNYVSASVSIDGAVIRSLSPGATTFSLATNSYFDGTHSFVVTTIDKAGNETVSTQTLFIDNTAPTLFFSEPINGEYVGGDVPVTVNVTELTSGLSRTHKIVLIDGIEAPGVIFCDIDIANNAPCSYDINTRGFISGPHTITARMFDEAGNIGETTITVNFDNIGPRLLSTSMVGTNFKNTSGNVMRFNYVDDGIGSAETSVDVVAHSFSYTSCSSPSDTSIKLFHFRGPTVSDIAGNTTTFPDQIYNTGSGNTCDTSS